jgi:hypothetical protein
MHVSGPVLWNWLILASWEGVMSWRRFVGLVAIVVLSLFLASLSGSLYQRTSRYFVQYEGAGRGNDSMQVVIGGWPLSFLEDRPYAFSPAGSVNISDGLRGLDRLYPWPFLGDAGLYAIVLLASYRVFRRKR